MPLTLRWQGELKKLPKGAYFHQDPLELSDKIS